MTTPERVLSRAPFVSKKGGGSRASVGAVVNLDVERLVRAMAKVWPVSFRGEFATEPPESRAFLMEYAERIAREYAALASVGAVVSAGEGRRDPAFDGIADAVAAVTEPRCVVCGMARLDCSHPFEVFVGTPPPPCAVHIHKAGQAPNDIDRCEACGHDLRALCHARAPGPPDAPKREYPEPMA